MGIVGLVIMFAPALGPTLSGVIVEYFGWRFLFIFVMPFTIFSILFALKYLVNITEITKPKIDWISILFSTIGLGATIYGFSHAGESANGFMTPTVFIPIIIGAWQSCFIFRQFKLVLMISYLNFLFSHAVVLSISLL